MIERFFTSRLTSKSVGISAHLYIKQEFLM